MPLPRPWSTSNEVRGALCGPDGNTRQQAKRPVINKRKDHLEHLGARGGVYIVGGVIPRFAELFLRSGFAASFADKGCMSGYFTGVPVWLVTAAEQGASAFTSALEHLK